jgi:alpha-maltose-1-phosphate synthase
MGATDNCAIHFFPEAFGPSGSRIFGRETASAGFLKAFVQHGGLETLYCCSPSPSYFDAFQRFVVECGSTRPTKWVSYANLSELSTVGCLYQSDPCIADLAWHRLRLGPTTLSLCGITHTLCSAAIMDAIGALLVAPIENWDALVCTSQTAKAVVEHVLGAYRGYLGSRFGSEIRVGLELPVIPLGVHCNSFDASQTGPQLRANARNQLGIGPEDIAVLFVGRLSYHAKAHPLPMYSSLEEVARQTRKTLHVLHFGWFANRELKQHFIEVAQTLCPTVKTHFLEERQDWHRAVWQAADIFMSLSDNFQETFGLTPLEAMAAGLPQVISDWDGYRDSVRDGIEGFRVPTVMPPPGAGADLAARYSVGIDNYDQYVGNTSQSVAVDVGSCVTSLERLVMNKDLRVSMGEAGRKRAREMFDWPVIIRAYQELWDELTTRRQRATGTTGRGPSWHPLREDPFSVFGQYASCTLDGNCIIDLGPNATSQRLRQITAMPMNGFSAHLLCSEQERAVLIDAIADEAPVLVGDLLERVAPDRRAVYRRTLGWLAKMDVIRVPGLTSGGLS